MICLPNTRLPISIFTAVKIQIHCSGIQISLQCDFQGHFSRGKRKGREEVPVRYFYA